MSVSFPVICVVVSIQAYPPAHTHPPQVLKRRARPDNRWSEPRGAKQVVLTIGDGPKLGYTLQ